MESAETAALVRHATTSHRLFTSAGTLLPLVVCAKTVSPHPASNSQGDDLFTLLLFVATKCLAVALATSAREVMNLFTSAGTAGSCCSLPPSVSSSPAQRQQRHEPL